MQNRAPLNHSMLDQPTDAPCDSSDEGLRLRAELDAGLRAREACISPKFLYDALGSKLFEAICELPEYYPTRTEAAIFERHGGEIARAVGTGATLIDLGAGNCAKAASLFPMLHPAQYVPVDISADFLQDAVERLRQRFRHIEMNALGMDFSGGDWQLPDIVRQERRLFFYPGSSIGNFTPAEAATFLAAIRAHCAAHPGSGLLIGVDTPKDPARLVAAYDDALGVTAAFNRNVLVHVNRVLGSDFDPAAFAHVARYDAAAQRIEMHLEARRAQEVDLDGVARHFHAGERIHTENSYKYAPGQFAAMLRAAGFASVRVWQDGDGDFAVCYAS
jgi:dimethylhistidine N-methyltransferase